MSDRALTLFERTSIEYNNVFYTTVFSACAAVYNEKVITLGNHVLRQMPNLFHDDIVVIGSAINMLMKFGDVHEAERLFDLVSRKSRTLYGAMMNGYNLNGLSERALDLFEDISCTMNGKLYAIIYSACAALCNARAVALGEQLLREMPDIFLTNCVVIGSAINMLMKFGQVEDAEVLFEKLEKKSMITYGVMMNGYKFNDQPQKCLTLFRQIKNENITPDYLVYLSLIGACSQIGLLSICRNIVDQIPIDLQNNMRLKTSLIDMWVGVV
jgi:pentatricopeptide repeat protein